MSHRQANNSGEFRVGKRTHLAGPERHKRALPEDGGELRLRLARRDVLPLLVHLHRRKHLQNLVCALLDDPQVLHDVALRDPLVACRAQRGHVKEGRSRCMKQGIGGKR